MASLGLEIKIGAVFGGAVAALGTVQGSLRRLTEATATLKLRQKELNKEMREFVGPQTPQALRALEDRYERLGRTIDRLAARHNQLTRLAARREDLRNERSALRSDAMDTLAIGATVAAPVKLAIDFESAMADVKKVVDFETPDGFVKLGDEILRMTRTLPLAATELAAIAASGGQLGVKAEDIPKFTETVAKMATAFDMSAEVAGDAMAKLANVYQIPIANIDKLGDAINQLSNESPAKASDIVSSLSRVGGVAKGFGLTELQAASLANAFISLGKPPEVAGTAINGMLMKLSTVDKQGPKFKAALSAMGMSAEGLKKAIATDAQGALLGFLQTLEKVPSDKRMGILVDMFGLEYADDVAVLAGSVKTYSDSIDSLNKKAADGSDAFRGSMEREFAARAATTANTLQLLKNGLSELGVNIGSAVLPALNDLVNSIRPTVAAFADWAKANPGFISGVMRALAIFAAGKVLFLGVGYAVNLAASSWTGLALTWAKAASMGTWLRAGWLLHGPMAVARVGGAFSVVGRAAVAAGPMVAAFGKGLLMTFIGPMKLAFDGAIALGRVLMTTLLSGMRAAGTGAMWLGRMLGGALLSGLRLAGQAVLFLGRALLMNPIGLIITGIAAGAYLVYRYWTPIKGFFLGLWGGIKSGFVSAWNGVTSIFTGIWSQITSAFSGGIAGVGKLIVNWSPMGLFYKAFSGVLSWFGVDLPKNFTDFGANIISGLTNGIKSAIGGAVTAIGDFASGLKSKFTNLLGIKSPSRVFMGFGGNIGEGVALGILQSVPGVQGAAGRLAGVALAGAVAASNTAVAGVNSSIQTRQPIEPPRLEAPAAQALRPVAPAAMPRVELPRMGVPRLDAPALPRPAATPAPMLPMPQMPRIEMPSLAASPVARLVASVVMPQASAPSPVRVDLPRLESPMLAAQPAVPASMQRVGEVTQAVARRESAADSAAAAPDQGMVIHFSPNISVGGGDSSGGDVRGQVQEGLKLSMRELEQMLRRLQAEQQRRAF